MTRAPAQAARAGAPWRAPASPRSICIEPGCPAPATERGRCDRHVQSTAQRGYGFQHQQARDELAATLPAECGYGCGTVLQSGGEWVAAHVVDGHPEYGWLAACQSCNLKARGTVDVPRGTVAAPAPEPDRDREPRMLVL